MHYCTILETWLAYIDTGSKMLIGTVSDGLSKHLDCLPLLEGIAGFGRECCICLDSVEM